MCYEMLGCKVRSPSNKNSQEKSLRGCGIWPKTQSRRTVMWGAGTRTTEPKRATTTTMLKRRQSEVLREAGTGPCDKSREPEKGLFEERLEKWAGSCQPCGGVRILFYMQWEITYRSLSGMMPMVGRIMLPRLLKVIHIRITEICVYITIHGKWDIVDVIKNLESWGLSCAQCHHKDSCKREAGDSGKMWQRKQRWKWYGSMSPGMQAASQAGESKGAAGPLEPPEWTEPSPANTLLFGPSDHDFQHLTFRTLREWICFVLSC